MRLLLLVACFAFFVLSYIYQDRSIKEEYAKLIREKTEWYDLSLVFARDKLVAHGDKYSMELIRQS